MRAKTLKFCGIDGWHRLVFLDDNGKFYKSVSIANDNNVEAWGIEYWKQHLANLHDTDEFDGEPGFPVDVSHVKDIVLPNKRIVRLNEPICISVATPKENGPVPSKVTVSVSRTVQERPYEPYNVHVSMEFTPPQHADINLVDEHIDRVRTYLESKVDAYCKERREAAVEPSRYYS